MTKFGLKEVFFIRERSQFGVKRIGIGHVRGRQIQVALYTNSASAMIHGLQ